MAHKTKEIREKTQKTFSRLPPNCLTRGSTPFLHSPECQTPIGPQRNKSRTFAKLIEIFVVAVPVFLKIFCIINFTITILLYLFLPPLLSFLFLCYSSLFTPTILSAPFHPLSPCLCLLQTVSYIFTTHWVAWCNKSSSAHPQPSGISDTSSLHYNSGTTPKHTRVPKSMSPISLPLPPISVAFTNYPGFYL
jgi:hypothetical protein